jgi:hypothetical protein
VLLLPSSVLTQPGATPKLTAARCPGRVLVGDLGLEGVVADGDAGDQRDEHVARARAGLGGGAAELRGLAQAVEEVDVAAGREQHGVVVGDGGLAVDAVVDGVALGVLGALAGALDAGAPADAAGPLGVLVVPEGGLAGEGARELGVGAAVGLVGDEHDGEQGLVAEELRLGAAALGMARRMASSGAS